MSTVTIRIILASCIASTLLYATGCKSAEGVQYRRHLSVVTEPADETVLAAWPQPAAEVVTMAEEPGGS